MQESKRLIQCNSQQAFYVKGQTVDILALKLPVTSTQLCCFSMKAAINTVQ